MKNSPQPSEQNELRTQYAQIKSPVENKSEEQMLLDYLIGAGFMLDEALQLLDWTLDEEKKADQTLTAIAGRLNFQAAAPRVR